MNTNTFGQEVKAMSDRLSNLFEGIDINSAPSPNLLPSAFKELGVAAEQLELAAKIVSQQHQKLSFADDMVISERQRYQELLEFIPDACFLTDAAGIIQQANSAAAQLLNLQPGLLIGRSLTAFVPPSTRQQFQSQLLKLQQKPCKQEWQARLQREPGVAFDMSVLVETSSKEVNQPLTLRWLLRHVNSGNGAILEESNGHASTRYPLQRFRKGETIPLKSPIIWQVRSGLVKLTTFSDTDEKVLVGLAGENAPFGSSLTALPFYEATALADSEVWCIPVADLATSPELKQQILSQIGQRLKQTELLLAIYGQRRVSKRLESLLELLKQEIGQPVADGTRLSVRLTHEDLASACCTTRVTITRLFTKLQQQNKVSVDPKNHLILKY